MATTTAPGSPSRARSSKTIRVSCCARQGISREVVSELSKIKGEPDWMAEKRLKALEIFERKPIPTWGPDLSALNLDDLVLYSPPTAGRFNSWDDVPAEMKQTYEDLGIPQAEREHLAGVVGVWRQEPVYEGLKEEYAKQGILFCSMDTAITEYPELVQKYFMNKCVPAQDNKFSRAARRRLVGRSLLLHPQGRQVRPAAAVLLPHGGRRRGHLRAHADRRRRGLGGELHRGLHRADLLGQLDALRGRRDLRPRGRQGALHDRAELVEGRLQPQHQARRRRRRRHRRVGRRLDGREVRDALPRLVPDGRGRARRPPQRRRRRQRRAQGHRREGRAPRAEHDLEHPRQVDLQGRRHHGLPRPREDGPELAGLESRACSATG